MTIIHAPEPAFPEYWPEECPDHSRETEKNEETEGGHILMEILVGVVILSMIIGGGMAFARSMIENRQVTATERGIVTLSEALYNYRMIEREWPGTVGDLSIYAPTFSGGGRNGVGQPYALDPPSPLNDPRAPIVIETDLLDADRATRVAREFPNTGSVTGTTLRVEVPVPGHEPAREAMLPRDGTRDMDGDLDMDGNDIDDVATINVGGEDLTGTAVDFINDLAALTCTGTQRVSVSGGQPRCMAVASTTTTTTTYVSVPSTPSTPTDEEDEEGGTPDPPDTPGENCPATPTRPSSLDSRAFWTCTKQIVNGSCAWNCRSSCGSGDAKMPQYTSYQSGRIYSYPIEDTCNSYYESCPRYSYSTDSGTCRKATCVKRCRQVR